MPCRAASEGTAFSSGKAGCHYCRGHQKCDENLFGHRYVRTVLALTEKGAV